MNLWAQFGWKDGGGRTVDQGSCCSCDLMLSSGLKKMQCISCERVLCQACFREYQLRSPDAVEFTCNNCNIERPSRNSFQGDSKDHVFEVTVCLHNFREFSRSLCPPNDYQNEVEPKFSKLAVSLTSGCRELRSNCQYPNEIMWKKPFTFFLDRRTPASSHIVIEVRDSLRRDHVFGQCRIPTATSALCWLPLMGHYDSSLEKHPHICVELRRGDIVGGEHAGNTDSIHSFFHSVLVRHFCDKEEGASLASCESPDKTYLAALLRVHPNLFYKLFTPLCFCGHDKKQDFLSQFISPSVTPNKQQIVHSASSSLSPWLIPSISPSADGPAANAAATSLIDAAISCNMFGNPQSSARPSTNSSELLKPELSSRVTTARKENTEEEQKSPQEANTMDPNVFPWAVIPTAEVVLTAVANVDLWMSSDGIGVSNQSNSTYCCESGLLLFTTHRLIYLPADMCPGNIDLRQRKAQKENELNSYPVTIPLTEIAGSMARRRWGGGDKYVTALEIATAWDSLLYLFAVPRIVDGHLKKRQEQPQPHHEHQLVVARPLGSAGSPRNALSTAIAQQVQHTDGAVSNIQALSSNLALAGVSLASPPPFPNAPEGRGNGYLHFGCPLQNGDFLELVYWITEELKWLIKEESFDVNEPGNNAISESSEINSFLKKLNAPFEMTSEFKRQNIQAYSKCWRVSAANRSFALCRTYPTDLVVPKGYGDAALADASHLRSAWRLPAMTWLHPNGAGALFRCAQPKNGLSGFMDTMCTNDDRLLVSIRRTSQGSHPIWRERRISKNRKSKIRSQIPKDAQSETSNPSTEEQNSTSSATPNRISVLKLQDVRSKRSPRSSCPPVNGESNDSDEDDDMWTEVRRVPPPLPPSDEPRDASNMEPSQAGHPPNPGSPLQLSPSNSVANNSDEAPHVIDENASICTSHSKQRNVVLRILDCRPYISAAGNAVMGKGFEDVKRLGGPTATTLRFAEIENIHKVRESYRALRQVLFKASTLNNPVRSKAVVGRGTSPSVVRGRNKDAGVPTSIGDSTWLSYISDLLKASLSTARWLNNGDPVVVHCSDGWDRTAQVCALAEVLLDPYYRSIQGLRDLIEKDFLHFGHRFRSRLGTGSLANNHVPPSEAEGQKTKDSNSENESSPIFLQFLDALWQIWRQFPAQFEFNEKLLVFLALSHRTGYTKEFMSNSLKKRLGRDRWKVSSIGATNQVTAREIHRNSLWSLIASHVDDFMSPLYFKHRPARGKLPASFLGDAPSAGFGAGLNTSGEQQAKEISLDTSSPDDSSVSCQEDTLSEPPTSRSDPDGLPTPSRSGKEDSKKSKRKEASGQKFQSMKAQNGAVTVEGLKNVQHPNHVSSSNLSRNGSFRTENTEEETTPSSSPEKDKATSTNLEEEEDDLKREVRLIEPQYSLFSLALWEAVHLHRLPCCHLKPNGGSAEVQAELFLRLQEELFRSKQLEEELAKCKRMMKSTSDGSLEDWEKVDESEEVVVKFIGSELKASDMNYVQ